MMNPESLKEHAWLQQLVGEWTYESESVAPAEPASEQCGGGTEVKCTGRETVRGLGPLWIVAEGRGEMPGGGQMQTVMTLGYDPKRSRFVGTWICSMMTHMWLYEGWLDEEERVLTLESEGPDMSGKGTTVKYRDVIEVGSGDHRTLSSFGPGEDGGWRRLMTAHYSRTK